MASIKIARNDVLNLFTVISKLIMADSKYGPKFLYFLSKNRAWLKNEVDLINEASDKTLASFRAKLKDSGAIENIDGKVSIKDQALIESITAEFKADIAASDSFLSEKIDVEVYKIDIDNVPELSTIFYDFIFNCGLMNEV